MRCKTNINCISSYIYPSSLNIRTTTAATFINWWNFYQKTSILQRFLKHPIDSVYGRNPIHAHTVHDSFSVSLLFPSQIFSRTLHLQYLLTASSSQQTLCLQLLPWRLDCCSPPYTSSLPPALVTDISEKRLEDLFKMPYIWKWRPARFWRKYPSW